MKTLLLNSSYDVLKFISERRMIKLIIKEKVEVEYYWDDAIISWGSGYMRHPAVVRLKNHIKRNFNSCNFSKKILIRRDDSECQYCGQKLHTTQITIDHIIPSSFGGKTSFLNCVVCCKDCNSKKGNKTLEESGMKLLRSAKYPDIFNHYYIPHLDEHWHPSWNAFISV